MFIIWWQNRDILAFWLGFYFSVCKRKMDLIASDSSGVSLSVSFWSLFFYTISFLQVGPIFKTHSFHIKKKTLYYFFFSIREVDFLLRNVQLLSQSSQKTCLSFVSLTSTAPYKEIILKPFLFQNKGHWGAAYSKVYSSFRENTLSS